MSKLAVNEHAGTSRRSCVAAAVCVMFAFVVGCSSAPSRSADNNGSAQQADAVTADTLRAIADRDRIEGSPQAPLWLIIASDFQCPYCAQWHGQSQDSIRQAYVQSGQLRTAYVNFPLEQHRHARVAAAAALCAGAQQRFWPMHDAIFAAQARWSALLEATMLFDSLAAAQGVEIVAWRKCMSDGVMDPVVRADRERASETGVQSTPTFLLLPSNAGAGPGQMIRGAVPLPELKRVIDSMLTAAAGGT